MRIENFGRNVVYQPKNHYAPATEEEVLEILEKHAHGSVRVWASGHSWSEVIIGNGAVVSLRYFSNVSVEEGKNETVARVGAGAVIHHILRQLHETSIYTLPTMGAIKRQTIAGATATATHGSGDTSMAQFIREVRLACYDADSNPRIKVIREGEELRAARTSLGCMGIILELVLQVVPKFWMKEITQEYGHIDAILAKEPEWSKQQFLVFPHAWRWYAYHRKEVAEPDKRAKRRMRWHKLYDYLVVELVMHAAIKVVEWQARLFGRGAITGFWKHVLPPFMRPVTVVGDSEAILTLHTEHHDTFRHVEMELFIPKENITSVAAFVQEVISYLAGTKDSVSNEISKNLKQEGLFSDLEMLYGTYVHHYPLFFRRILPEDTLIAMNSSSERYSMSFFTFEPPRNQGAYNAACDFLARACARLYSVRPHWGKYNPLSYEDLAPLYPELDHFREICRRHDPNGVFQNEYTRRVLEPA